MHTNCEKTLIFYDILNILLSFYSVLKIEAKDHTGFLQSMTNIIFPKLEKIANEIIDHEDLSIINAQNRPKALTFLHLSLISLLIELSNQSEELYNNCYHNTLKVSKGNLDIKILFACLYNSLPLRKLNFMLIHPVLWS